jgi:amino acid transporter
MAEEVGVYTGILKSMLTNGQVRDASRTVPRMTMLTTVINGALGLAATITACFITVDIERQILNGDPNYPYIAILAEALDGVGGAVTLATGATVIAISKNTNACSDMVCATLTRHRHVNQRGCCGFSPGMGFCS